MTVNKLILGDNLEIMKTMDRESIDLIYLDPPFFSNRNYEIIWGDDGEVRSFKDRWSGGMDHYIGWLKERVEQMHRMLKPTGSIFLHCDWHADAYIRVEILDRIFGQSNLRNVIIWQRTNAKGLAFTRLSQNHDTIFYYSKSNQLTWNPIYLSHHEDYLKSFYKYTDPESGRIYRLADITNPNKDRPNLTYEFLGVTRVWRWTKERMQEAYENGMILQVKPGSVPQFKRFLDEQEGKCIICGNPPVWMDKKLVFVIDHIDGDCSNNKRKNLRFICPNCDSQTDTFKSKTKNSKRRDYLKENLEKN